MVTKFWHWLGVPEIVGAIRVRLAATAGHEGLQSKKWDECGVQYVQYRQLQHATLLWQYRAKVFYVKV